MSNKLNCNIIKTPGGDNCDVCHNDIDSDEYYVDTDILSAYGVTICLPCIDKIRTELIKKNPGVKLP